MKMMIGTDSCVCVLINRPRSSIDTFTRGIQYMIKNDRLLKASEFNVKLCKVLLNIENQVGYNKWCLACVIILLAAGDEIAARKCIAEFGSTFNGEEVEVCHSLLDSWENYDHDLFEASIKSRCVTFLDTEVARLASTLTFPGGNRTVGASSNDAVSGTVDDLGDFC